MSWNGEKPVTAVVKKVDDFRQKWFLIGAKSQSSFLDTPEAPPVKNTHWGKLIFQGP